MKSEKLFIIQLISGFKVCKQYFLKYCTAYLTSCFKNVVVTLYLDNLLYNKLHKLYINVLFFKFIIFVNRLQYKV